MTYASNVHFHQAAIKPVPHHTAVLTPSKGGCEPSAAAHICQNLVFASAAVMIGLRMAGSLQRNIAYPGTWRAPPRQAHRCGPLAPALLHHWQVRGA